MIKPITRIRLGEGSPRFDSPAALVQRFEGSTVVRQGTCMTQSGRAKYYDISFPTQSGTTFVRRVVHARLEGVRFEIILQTLPHQFDSSLRQFQGFLTSFQTDKPKR